MLAKFGGYMECIDADTVDTDGDGIPDAGDGVIQYAECTIYDESLQLWLSTLDAQAFFFALDDVGTGWHDVEVQARILVSGSSQTGATATRGWVGKGSLTIEEVRLVKEQDITSNGSTIVLRVAHVATPRRPATESGGRRAPPLCVRGVSEPSVRPPAPSRRVRYSPSVLPPEAR